MVLQHKEGIELDIFICQKRNKIGICCKSNYLNIFIAIKAYRLIHKYRILQAKNIYSNLII